MGVSLTLGVIGTGVLHSLLFGKGNYPTRAGAGVALLFEAVACAVIVAVGTGVLGVWSVNSLLTYLRRGVSMGANPSALDLPPGPA
jgi:hypothetical protein